MEGLSDEILKQMCKEIIKEVQDCKDCLDSYCYCGYHLEPKWENAIHEIYAIIRKTINTK